jgi:nitrate reductase gamma subunit
MAVALAAALYAAAALCLSGLAWRVWRWARSPEPFRIPTTTGQQRSLGWIAPSRVESPSTRLGVAGRLALEALLFRSLFRNTAHASPPGPAPCPPPVFQERKGLWLGAMALHWSLAVIVVRHLRLFVDPVPGAVAALSSLDGFFEVGSPRWYATDVVAAAALLYLLGRRLRDPLQRYLTLPADYLALGALMAVVGTGIVLRHVARVDLVDVRAFTLGLVAFAPAPLGANLWLAAHAAAAAVLLAALPFTKMVHAAGVWLSPTRNQANDSRRRRHVNPWNAPVPVHGYAAWRDEFRDKLAAAGLPIDETPEGGPPPDQARHGAAET